MSFYDLLERRESDKNDVTLTTIPHGISLRRALLSYSHPIPAETSLGDKKAIFVPGGLRRGGRYPDIIINHSDFERARSLLDHLIGATCGHGGHDHDDETFEKIVAFVRSAFKTDQAVKFEMKDQYVAIAGSWKLTIDKATQCFVEKVYKCNSPDTCYQEKLKYPLTLTNLTALPYLIGDCREHAWVAAFLAEVYLMRCSALTRNPYRSRVFYTRVFICDDANKKLMFFEEHVFVLIVSDTDVVHIMDPLYADSTSVPRIEYNKTIAKTVNVCELASYRGYAAFYSNLCYYQQKSTHYQPSIILECGHMVLEDGRVVRLINVPVYYDGSLRVITNPIGNDATKVMILNHPIDLSQINEWHEFSDWCTNP